VDIAVFGYMRAELFGEPVEVLLPERYRRTQVSYRTGYSFEPRTRAKGAGPKLFGRRKDGSECGNQLGPARNRRRVLVSLRAEELKNETKQIH
jgi:two-component system, LuxR family, sensor kinase FixL